MPIEILMPALSPTMEEGTLAKWLVKEGDTVSSGDLLAEIETDKATMEFEAVDEGIVGKLLVKEGTEGVKVNSPIAVMLADDESTEDIKRSENANSHKEKTKDMPTSTVEEIAKAPTSQQDLAKPSKSGGGDRVFASPLARRIAADRGIELAQIKGSGPHGRIIKSDVEAAKPTAEVARPTEELTTDRKESVSASYDAIAKIYADREFQEIKLDGMRKTITARLTEAKQTIPHFYLRRDIELDALLSLRSTLNRQLEPRDVKLSVNDFIIKACAVALQMVPDANAVWAGDRILKLGPSDVAVAVAIEGGLFTPVLRDAHSKSLSSLSTEMKDLAARAKDRKLAPHEYQGGSFAISNLGMFGIDSFDAVINPPHGAILAVGAGIKKPVVGTNGQLTSATLMSATLSVDHRVIDGALGSELLAAIKQNLENPIAMLA